MARLLTLCFLKSCFHFCLLLVPLTVFSQQQKIYGKLYDDKQKPIEFANISLLKNSETKPFKGTFSDTAGYFEFKDVPLGEYILKITGMGYVAYQSEKIVLTAQRPSYTFKGITLTSDAKTLNSVVISAKKALIEQRADKMVMNVENSILAEGNTALEILERAPGVSVDNDGNITLRGKQGVTVMINGKLTYLSQKDLTNLLRGTSSASISTIEVITNPSAKYDAAGNSGIINIKMKKNIAGGFNGNSYVNYGRGRKNRYGAGVNLNYKMEKVNVFGSYDHAYRGESETFRFNRNFYDSGVITNQPDRTSLQQSSTDEPLYTNNFKAGVDYHLNEKTTLGTVLNGNVGSYTNNNISNNRIINNTGNLISDASTDNRNAETWESLGGNLNFSHHFNNKGKELSADLDFSNADFEANQLLDTKFAEVFPNAAYTSLRRGFTPANTKVYVAKVDYAHPFGDKATFETGLKSSYVNADNNANYDTLQVNNWVVDQQTTNRFIYKEQIHAGYLNYKHNFSKMDIQVGLRGEYTLTTGHQVTTDSLVKRDYFQLFPSIFVGKPLGENHKVNLSYSRRIDRPDYFDLNPFRFFRDPFLFYEGNPFLQPELTHASEISYAYKSKYILSVYFNHTNQSITNIISQLDASNTTILRPQNLTSLQNYGANLTISLTPAKWWATTNFVNGYKNNFKNIDPNSQIRNGIWTYTVNSQHSFQLKSNLSAELSGRYFAKSVYGLFTRKAFYEISAGLQQQLFNKRANLKLAVKDIFKTRTFDRTVVYQNIDMTENINLDNRIGTITFSYRFGKQDNERRKRATDDDVQKRVKGM